MANWAVRIQHSDGTVEKLDTCTEVGGTFTFERDPTRADAVTDLVMIFKDRQLCLADMTVTANSIIILEHTVNNKGD